MRTGLAFCAGLTQTKICVAAAHSLVCSAPPRHLTHIGGIHIPVATSVIPVGSSGSHLSHIGGIDGRHIARTCGNHKRLLPAVEQVPSELWAAHSNANHPRQPVSRLARSYRRAVELRHRHCLFGRFFVWMRARSVSICTFAPVNTNASKLRNLASRSTPTRETARQCSARWERGC